MTNKQTLFKTVVSLILAGTLSACSTNPRTFTGVEVQKRNIVEHVRLTQNISFSGPEGALLSEDDQKQLSQFLRGILVNYSDLVSLDIPPGPNSDEKRKALKEFLKYRGIILADGSPISGPLPNGGEGVLVIDRYIATAPNCDYHALSKNLQSPNHGCSSQTILGQMVANSKDLVDGQTFQNTSTQNQVNTLRGFKNGQQSGSPLPSPVTGGQTSTSQPQS